MRAYSKKLAGFLAEISKVEIKGPVTAKDKKDLQDGIAAALCHVNLNSPLRENRKLLYQEAGQWARHYSTVRMTVMTFTITTCTAIIAWKWQAVFDALQKNQCHHEDIVDVIMIPVAVLWAAGVFVFWIFTYHTYKQVGRQMEKRPLLPSEFEENFKPHDVPLDWASFIIPVLTGGFGWLVNSHFYLEPAWAKGLCAFTAMGALMPVTIWLGLSRRVKTKAWKKVLVSILIIGGLSVLAACFEPQLVALIPWMR